MSKEFKDLIKAVTGVLSLILGVLTALSFLEGFAANSSNLDTMLAFLLTWYIFTAVTEELNSSLKRILISLGLPTFLVALILTILSFT